MALVFTKKVSELFILHTTYIVCLDPVGYDLC